MANPRITLKAEDSDGNNYMYQPGSDGWADARRMCKRSARASADQRIVEVCEHKGGKHPPRCTTVYYCQPEALWEHRRTARWESIDSDGNAYLRILPKRKITKGRGKVRCRFTKAAAKFGLK